MLLGEVYKLPKINFDYVNPIEVISPTKFNNNFRKLEEAINSGVIGSKSSEDTPRFKEYGVEWDINNARFIRLSDAVGLSKGNDFDQIYPWSKIRRCKLSDEGIVSAYLGDQNWNRYPNNQIMVEIPKFYYKVVPLDLNPLTGQFNKIQYFISDGPLPNYSLHPAFIRAGTPRDYIYIGAYQAVLDDYPGNGYKNDQAFQPDINKLGSVPGYIPVSGQHSPLTRANARKMAQKRGQWWGLQDFLLASALQLLILVELATTAVATEIGVGYSYGPAEYHINHALRTGYSDSLGNQSGQVNLGPDKMAVNYRGVENFWSNIWMWVDGINIRKNNVITVYVADHGYDDNLTNDPYIPLGCQLANNEGFASRFAYSADASYAFLAGVAGGNSTKPPASYYWHSNVTASPQLLTAKLGGNWSMGSLPPSATNWALDNFPDFSGAYIGTRIGYYGPSVHLGDH